MDVSLKWLIEEVPGQPLIVPADLATQISLDDRKIIHTKQEEAIKQCMNQRGFHYEMIPIAASQSSSRSRASDYFGLSPLGDVETARAIGYGQPPLPRNDSSIQEPSVDEISDAESSSLEALLGAPPEEGQPGVIKIEESDGITLIQTNSCIGEANNSVFDDGNTFSRLQAELDIVRTEMEYGVRNDEDFQRSLNVWRNCMEQHGFYSDSPEYIWIDLVHYYHEGKITLSEYHKRSQDSALPNAVCVNESNYVQEHNRAVERAAQHVAVRAEGVLTAYKEMVSQALL